MSTTAKEFGPLDAPVDLDRYPIHEPGLPAAVALADSCRRRLREGGSFSLPRFLHPDGVQKCLAQLAPL